MSYFQNISNVLDNEVTSFLKNVSTTFKISESELLEMWKTQNSSPTPVQVSSTPLPPTTAAENSLLKLSKSELVEMCKGKGLKVSGSKTDLVSRIQESENKKTNIFKKDDAPKVKNVVNKLAEKIPVIQIKKNKYGNFEHTETGLLYDNKTAKIYGKQNSDGSVEKLTKDDIDTCNKYKFSYIIPDNLDTVDDDGDDEVVIEDDVYEEEEEEEEEDEEEEEEAEEEIEIEEDYE